MKYFCLPSDFRPETLRDYHELNNLYENARVVETYGRMDSDPITGINPPDSQTPAIDRYQLEKYVRYGRDRGLEFSYLLDPSFSGEVELTSEGFRKIKFFFRMLRDLGVSSITLFLPTLMEIARAVVPDLKIKASGSCRIDSPPKAQFFAEIGATHLILDEDILRRPDIIRRIRKTFMGELEISVNSFCATDCPLRVFHHSPVFQSDAGKNLYPYYISRCRNRRMSAESFMKLNWLRPEDLHYYEEAGVQYFRLLGRTDIHAGHPIRAAASYMEGEHDGDLVALLELFSPERPLAIAGCKVDNRKLDGFFEKFMNQPESCTKDCSECGHCRKYAEASICQPDRVLLDVMRTMDRFTLDEFPDCLAL